MPKSQKIIGQKIEAYSAENETLLQNPCKIPTIRVSAISAYGVQALHPREIGGVLWCRRVTKYINRSAIR